MDEHGRKQLDSEASHKHTSIEVSGFRYIYELSHVLFLQVLVINIS